MGIYEQYAAVYDQSGQLAFSHRMLPYLERLLKRHPAPGREVIELACGTGTVAIALARAGWRVLGVDASADMLAQAQAKLGDERLEIRWCQQDMRCLRVPAPAPLVTCLYDSMNYMLSDEDLLAVFARVREALSPGGLFLFDMNTLFALRSLWNDETYFTDGDDLAVVFKSRYDDRVQRATVRVTCFQRVDTLYRKITEEHTEQAYPPEHVATLLTDVGLTVEAQYDCFTLRKPSPASFRIMFVARRPPTPEAPARRVSELRLRAE